MAWHEASFVLNEQSSFLKGLDHHFCFDSNCLFRALGDQLEGHSRNHLKHRQETVDYMIKQREDFEPFVEDDIPFEKHGRFTVEHRILQESRLLWVIECIVIPHPPHREVWPVSVMAFVHSSATHLHTL